MINAILCNIEFNESFKEDEYSKIELDSNGIMIGSKHKILDDNNLDSILIIDTSGFLNFAEFDSIFCQSYTQIKTTKASEKNENIFNNTYYVVNVINKKDLEIIVFTEPSYGIYWNFIFNKNKDLVSVKCGNY